MQEATALVQDKLDLRETTTKQAITRAKKEGLLLKRNRLLIWTVIVQEKVAARLQEQQQPQAEATAEPVIAEAPQVV